MSIGKFTISGGLLRVLKNDLFKVEEFNPDEPNRTSMFGTPVYSNLEIEPFQFTKLDGTKEDIKNGIVIDTVMMNVTMTKNIVRTPIQGRNGTVKEYISDGDFEIDITGIIASKSNNYPESEVNELIRIVKSPVSIRFISEYLQFFGIHDVVVNSYNFPQTEGVRNQQIFQLSCSSDVPIELQTAEI